MTDTASSGLRAGLLLCTALVPVLTGAPARANPSGGTIVAGQAAIGPGGRILTITQNTNRAIINWQNFSIGTGETTRFNLPSSGAAVLNRVTGVQLSALLGNLYSNGQVYLLNPNGILVGPNGRVNTGGFVASTLGVSNEGFLAGGPQNLQGTSTAGIVVLGTVKADSGDVLLVAAQVDNQGKLIAPNGQAILAAGSEVLYVPGEDGNIVIAAPAPTSGAAVSNSGLIKAASVQLAAAGSAYALAVNNGGQVSVTGIRKVGGHVVLDGGGGDVVSSGAITAPGGSVTLTGGRVALTGGAVVDVSGRAGGGSVTLAASNAIAVTAGATINANATAKGNGGTISIKAATATQFAGIATATGGPQGGNGGSAEISGGALSFSGTADLSAPNGTTGALLFDPLAITIVSGNAAVPTNISGGLWGFAQDTGSGQTISVGAIETLLGSANLELQASNTLTVATPVAGSFSTIASNTANILTLTSPTITVNASISLPNGTLVFNWPDADVTTFSATAQSVTSAASATITASTLQVAGNYSTVTLNGPVTTSSLQFTEPNFATGITINNAANDITAVSFGSGRAAALDLETSSALTVSGTINAVVPTAILLAGGDLTLQSGFVLSGGSYVILASTGGVIDNLAGSAAVTDPNGLVRLYSATNGVGASGTTFNDGGIGAAATSFNTVSGVSYPANPNTTGSVVEYFVTTSATPTLTITANSFTRVFGQSDPSFTASYAGGSGGGAGELTTDPSFRIVQGSDVNAGAYLIEPFGAVSTVDLLRYVDGTLIVNQAPLSVAANSATMTYGGTLPGFSSNITGFLGSDTAALITGLLLASNAGTNPSAGGYTITPSGATVATPPGGTEPNYAITYHANSLTVNPAPLTVTASAATATYGAAIPTFQLNFSGFVNGGDAASVPGQFDPISAAVQGSGVGAYPITLAAGNPNSNYTVTYNGANLSISQAPLTITPNLSKLYGAALPATLPASDFSGLVAGDTPASLTTQPVLMTAATAASNVGGYSITASGAVDANYSIGYAPGTISVTPAPLLITANSAVRNYGTSNPAFGASYSGLVNGDTSAAVSGLNLGTTATGASNVGAYAIVPSGASASNYTVGYANGTLTINPVTLVIRPVGSSTYGASPASTAVVTYNTSGLVNGDTLANLTTQPAFSTSATSTSNAGLYGLLASGAADPNYTISYQPGVLTVNPATLTLAPISAFAFYGSTNASFGPIGLAVGGLANGDTLANVFATPPTVFAPSINGLPAGSYGTSVSAGRVIDNNYAASFAPGTLTIEPASLTITPNLTVPTNAALPALLPASDFAGFVNGDTLASLTTQPTLAIGNNLGPTSAQITASGAVDPNYTIGYQPGILNTSSTFTIGSTVISVPPGTLINSGVINTTTATTPVTLLPGAAPTITLSLASTVTINPNYNATFTYGPTLGTFGVEAGNIIDMFLATMTDSTPPITTAQVMAALQNPATSTAMLGDLLPFIYTDLSNILALPQSSWTAAQAYFVQAVQTYIQAQRQAAAQQAEVDYEAWAQQQQASEMAQLNAVSGPAQVEELAILSGNPPVPPGTFLQEVQAGMTMTNSQALTAAGITGQAVALGDAITGTQLISQSTELAGVGFQLGGSASGSTGIVKALAPSFINKIMPSLKKGTFLKSERKGVNLSEDFEEGTGLADKIGSAVAVAGVVLEVVGNAVQIAMAAVSYAQASQANTAFQNAVNAANQPVSVADLAAMMSGSGQSTLNGYLTAFLATGPVNPFAATTQPTMSLSAMFALPQSL